MKKRLKKEGSDPIAGFGIIEGILGGQQGGLLANQKALSPLNNPEFLQGAIATCIQQHAGSLLKIIIGEVAREGVLNAMRGG